MEFVDGPTLRTLLADGPLPQKKMLNVAAQAADGLANAHAAGIVHRDLKPENLMITKDGLVKILDFGVAKLVQPIFETAGPEAGAVTTWEIDTFLGTAGYMSPEQASGRPADFRSDPILVWNRFL
jgi:serine/threonine protein kinase